MDQSSPEFSQLQKPLEQFRAKTKRLKIHPLELGLLWVLSVHLAIMPWALGTMREMGQWTSLGFSIVGFIIALLPRRYTEEHTGSNTFRLVMWPKLAKWPLFWLGLALLVLVLIQALNPAWAWESNVLNWWMTPIPHKTWLPSGARVPWDWWGPWRKLLIFSDAFLTFCAVWVGITRRRTVQLLLIALAANGLALAGFGLMQRMLGNGRIFWFIVSPNSQFFASFIYKNHAGAYFILALALTCGLAAWYYLRGLRRMEKSNPAGLFVFFATCVSVAILTSYARGATIIMLAFLVVCVGVFVVHQLVIPSENRKPVVAVAMILIFGFFLVTGVRALNSKEAWTRLSAVVTQGDAAGESRQIARQAAEEMLHDHWLGGVGAGGFEFLFPQYQFRHPEITIVNERRMFWEHAHNDILEFAIELGVPGMLIILAGVAYLGTLLVRNYFWANPLSGCIVLGLGLLVIYSWWDFPFQCPAVLVLWGVLAVTAVQWAQFEEQHVRG